MVFGGSSQINASLKSISHRCSYRRIALDCRISRGKIFPMTRCPWAKNERSIPYHDEEWGVPVHDDRLLFEFLILEGAQAGLSWSTILKKRENYRKAFDGFRAERIARYDR